ncbi:hypothetical protein [Nitratifractor sp.]|uniref:hypothetical protein n=1 Tax=Nitratifractor sp. TaxID=2268144 RepID=UPI0025D027CE|nr:hypothetical protein [Nitratifractor sp.]
MYKKNFGFLVLFYLIAMFVVLNICEAGNTDQDDRQVKWFLEQHKDLKKNYFDGKFGVDNNPAGWDTGTYLRAYIDMYEATHDVRVLRDLNELLKIVADGNDALTGRIDDRTGKVMPGWGTRAYDYGPNGDERYSDMLMNALYAYPLAAFARIVMEDSNLAHEFGSDAKRYYRMVQDLYKAHKPFVHDEDSPYPDDTRGVYFAYPENYYEDKIDYSDIETPINMTMIVAEPLVEMYRASVAKGKPKKRYRAIVKKVSNYIRWNMHLKKTKKGDRYFTWLYWPADIDQDSRHVEDVTHGARLAEFVVSMHEAGLRNRWGMKRLRYLANTFTCGAVINNTSFANYIDGTGGVYEDDAATLYEWLVLQKYSHHSSRHTILHYLRRAMKHEGDNRKYNIAVFAKFMRYEND